MWHLRAVQLWLCRPRSKLGVRCAVVALFFTLVTACNSGSGGESEEVDACGEGAESCGMAVSDGTSDTSETSDTGDTASEWPFLISQTESHPPAPPPPQVLFNFPEAVAVFPIVSPVPLPDQGNGNTSEPNYLSPLQLSEFGTWLTRISDNEVFGVSNGQATHLYSKHQAWNADESYLDVGNYILDAQTYEIIAPIPLSTARNWSNVHPDLMLGIRYNPSADALNILAVYDMRQDQVENLAVFSDYRQCSFGDQEGNLSRDDRYLVLSCTEQQNGRRVLISYDTIDLRVLGTREAADNYNWASVSPSGNYILVENNRFPDENPRLWRYDLRLENGMDLGSPAHGDFGTDDQGDEAYVMINGDRFFYVRLRDGSRVNITLDQGNFPAGHGHLTCRNTFRPGWCYFSSRESGRVGAIRVSPSAGLIEPWGYHYSTSSSYAASPKVTANRSGTRLLFSSDWQGSAPISDYILEVR